ncbi:MAG TPA: MerR family transcriptional regulator [Syntrophorhabdaceae bacterium]|nr:MerR family transcriptional regulator [Syntrophorhabdaceae bacterium]
MAQEVPERVYYRIKEVCNLTGLKPHVLRYWEQEFKDIRPIKSPRGQRLYKRKDLDTIITIKKLLYDKKYTIDGAKKFLNDKRHIMDEIKEGLKEIIAILQEKQ